MKRTLRPAPALALLLLAALLQPALAQPDPARPDRPLPLPPDLPAAWMDSLHAGIQAQLGPDDAASYRMSTVTHVLEEDGAVQESDTVRFLVEQSGGEVLFHELNAAGEITEERARVEEVEEKEEGSGKLSAAFDPRYREKYRIRRLVPDGQGHLRLAWAPVEELEEGFIAEEAVVDTTGWRLLSVTGRPDPLPSKRLKEMTITMRWEPDEEGRWWLRGMESLVYAKVLLFSMRARIEVTYTDYELR